MNRVKFFNALRTRSSVLFGSSLTTPQVLGIDALLTVDSERLIVIVNAGHAVCERQYGE